MIGDLSLPILREFATSIAIAAFFSLMFSIRRITIGRVTRLAISWDVFVPAASIAIPLAAVAFVTGYLTGLSRQPAVTATIPAILTLVGGIFVYITASHPAARASMGIAIVVFATVLVLSTNYYSFIRESERIPRLLLLSEHEKIIRTRRHNMDLPADFPEWILSGEPSR